jgi:hypothetical protein
MITFLKAFLAGILVLMAYVTAVASLDRSVLSAGAVLLRDSWGRATLADAYFGFTTFFLWVAYLGNTAISVYVLVQLFRLPPGSSVEALLLRRT